MPAMAYDRDEILRKILAGPNGTQNVIASMVRPAALQVDNQSLLRRILTYDHNYTGGEERTWSIRTIVYKKGDQWRSVDFERALSVTTGGLTLQMAETTIEKLDAAGPPERVAMTRESHLDLIKSVGAHTVLMNAWDYANLRKLPHDKESLDSVCQLEVIQSGVIAMSGDARITSSRAARQGTSYYIGPDAGRCSWTTTIDLAEHSDDRVVLESKVSAHVEWDFEKRVRVIEWSY
jgi:hypothetical protein